MAVTLTREAHGRLDEAEAASAVAAHLLALRRGRRDAQLEAAAEQALALSKEAIADAKEALQVAAEVRAACRSVQRETNNHGGADLAAAAGDD